LRGAQLGSSGQCHTAEAASPPRFQPSLRIMPPHAAQQHSRYWAPRTAPTRRRTRCPAGLDPVDALAAGPFGRPCLRLSRYSLWRHEGTHSSCAHQSKPRRRHRTGGGEVPDCMVQAARHANRAVPPSCSSDSPMPAEGIPSSAWSTEGTLNPLL
jgi:hypothetical protein